MEQVIGTQQIRNRSARACIVEGFRLFADHLKILFQRSWLYALCYAIAYTLVGIYYLQVIPQSALLVLVSENNNQFLAVEFLKTSCKLFGAVLLFFIAATTFASFGFQALKEHLQLGRIAPANKWYTFNKNTAWRTIKAVFFTGIIVCLAGGLYITAVYMSHWLNKIAATCLCCLFAVALLFILLPVSYVATKYIFEEGTGFWENLTHKYSTGLRHLSFIFVVQLITSLVIAAATLFATLPASLLTIANLQSQIGMLNGDASGMPNYIFALTITIFAIAGFLQAYIHLSTLYPTFFMYTSIEVQEKERRNFLKDNQSYSKNANIPTINK